MLKLGQVFRRTKTAWVKIWKWIWTQRLFQVDLRKKKKNHARWGSPSPLVWFLSWSSSSLLPSPCGVRMLSVFESSPCWHTVWLSPWPVTFSLTWQFTSKTARGRELESLVFLANESRYFWMLTQILFFVFVLFGGGAEKKKEGTLIQGF